MDQSTANFLDAIPKFVIGISFAVLSLSVVHEWAYFSVIGLRYLTFVSAADYLSNAITWLPAASIALLVGILLRAIERRLALQAAGEEGSRDYISEVARILFIIIFLI